jgi:hypothetical protein
MVQPGSGRFSQIDREELDNEQIIVRSSRSTCEVTILQPHARVGFAVVFGDVAQHSKASWEMSVAHVPPNTFGADPSWLRLRPS